MVEEATYFFEMPMGNIWDLNDNPRPLTVPLTVDISESTRHAIR